MDGDRSSKDPTSDEGAIAAKRNALAHVGQTVGGRYLVEKIIALGGMGAVFRAEHIHMRKRVALKILHPMAQNLPELAARFERESIVGSHVRHRNVCSATDFGRTDDGSHYLVLEHVEGRTLGDLLKEGPFPPERAAEIARQLAGGLGAAHELGIYHRDVKPSNVMVDLRAGVEVKLIDFGLAKLPAELLRPGEQVSVTTSGTVFGTVAYMAPELARGMQAVDHRSDLYALGIILFEMLAGKHPFEAKNPSVLFRQHRSTTPPAIAERLPGASVSPELEAVVQKLIAKDPDHRYQSAADLIDALDEASPPEPIPARVTRTSLLRGIPPSRRSDPSSAGGVAPASSSPMALAIGDSTDSSDACPPPAAASLHSTSRRARGNVVPKVLLAFAAIGIVAAVGVRYVAPEVEHRLGSNGSAAASPEPYASSMLPSSAATPSTPTPVAAIATAAPSADPAAVAAEVAHLRNLMSEAATARNAKRGSQALIALAKVSPEALRDRDGIATAAAIAVNVELGDRGPADDVFALLGSDAFGTAGPDVLFYVTSFYGGSRGAARAAALLATPEVLAQASPALRIARELKNAPCKDRGPLLDRAAADGDDRSLAVLTAMLAPDCSDTPGACCAPFDPRAMAAAASLRERSRK